MILTLLLFRTVTDMFSYIQIHTDTFILRYMFILLFTTIYDNITIGNIIIYFDCN